MYSFYFFIIAFKNEYGKHFYYIYELIRKQSNVYLINTNLVNILGLVVDKTKLLAIRVLIPFWNLLGFLGFQRFFLTNPTSRTKLYIPSTALSSIISFWISDLEVKVNQCNNAENLIIWNACEYKLSYKWCRDKPQGAIIHLSHNMACFIIHWCVVNWRGLGNLAWNLV